MPEDFIARLRILIDECADGVYSRFGKMIHVSATTMQRYLESRAQPGYDIICRICRICGVTPNWLLFGWDPKYGAQNKATPQAIRIVDLANAGEMTSTDFVTVPILSDCAWSSADKGLTLIGPDTVEGFTIAPAVLGGRLCACRAKDESMAPEIEQGDLLLVNLGHHEPEEMEGRLVLAQVDSQQMAPRRLLRNYLFAGDPHRHPPLSVSRRRIVGVIVQIRRDSEQGEVG
jgi:transcriptional regulator with XRE-family HTH domain